LEAQVSGAEARAETESEHHRRFQDRLLALIEGHASRNLVNQLNRLIGVERE